MVDERKVDIIRKGKPFSRFDIVAIAIALILAAAYIVLTYVFREKGAELVITQADTGRVTKYSLDENREVTLNGLLIEIKNGEVWVSESSCNNQLCVHQGHKKYVGEQIICAPNKVHIKIEGYKIIGEVG